MLITVLLLEAGQVFAQESRGLLEEILVTARKRSENSQSIGLSMAVFDADALKTMNLKSLPDVSSAISNVELFEDFSGAGLPTWIIRGVGLQDFNTNNTPTAAVYVDEVYQTSTVMGTVGLFDVEQVEVLKGPQGGLYGRNTSGGAVLLKTRRPELQSNSGYTELSYSRWQNLAAEGAVNVGLTDSTALRVSGRSLSSSGAWQKSVVDNKAHGEKDLWDVRSWFTFQPSDNFTFDWKIQGGRDDSEIQLGRSVGLYAPNGGFCQAVLEGRRDDENCLNWAGVNRSLLGLPFEPAASQRNDGSLVLSDPINQQKNNYLSNTFFISQKVVGATFFSISSFDRFDYGVDLDLDGSRGEFAHRLSSSDIEVLSQEFRLVSDSNERLNWLLGLSYNDEKFKERRDFLWRDNFLVVQQLGFEQARLAYNQTTRSAAVYGSLDYEISPRWSLNAALRYTDEDKTYKNGSLSVPVNPPVFLYRDLKRQYSLGSHWSGKAGLEWTPRDGMLVYGTLSRGFKSGGFFGGFPDVAEQVSPYKEEKITAYELGIKRDWFRQSLRLNASVFYYDYQDVQGFVTSINSLTNTQIDVLTNQGDAEHAGAEVELVWAPVEGLSLTGNISYLDARFKRSEIFSRNIDGILLPIEGRRPFAPEWSGAFAVNYVTTIAENYRMTGNLNYHYRSEFSGRLTSPADRAVNRLPGYGLLGARLDLSRVQDDWSLALWAKNILDKSYLNRIKSDGLRSYIDLFGEPRSFGASLSYQW
ncbi:MAG: TonB-dependent receptor [Pseudomonadales bacterium]|nr:TonB-dependent receptor [Pseudomonadales bacterium]